MLNLKEMLTSICHKLIAQYGTVTSSYSSLSDGYSELVKIGNTVFLTLRIIVPAGTTISSYGVIAVIPSGFRPVKQLWSTGVRDTTYFAYDITMGGNVRTINPISTSAASSINLSIAYRTA